MVAAHAFVPSRRNVSQYVENCKAQSNLLDAISVVCLPRKSVGGRVAFLNARDGNGNVNTSSSSKLKSRNRKLGS